MNQKKCQSITNLLYFILIVLIYNPTRLIAIQYDRGAFLTPISAGRRVLAVDNLDPRRMQIRVPNQFAKEGGDGGNASCGYHALRNGILIACSQAESDQKDTYLNSLFDVRVLNQTFGYLNSTWRSLVMKERCKRVAQKIIFDTILQSLKGEKNEILYVSGAVIPLAYKLKLRQVCTQITRLPENGLQVELDRLVHHLSRAAYALADRCTAVESGYRFSATADEIYAAFPAGSLTREIFNRYCNDISIDFTVKFDQIAYATDNSIIHKDKECEPYGHWVQTEELLYLVNYDKTHGILRNKPEFIIGSYGSLEGNIAASFNTCTEEFQDLYVRMTTTNEDIIAILTVYTKLQALKELLNPFNSFMRYVFPFMFNPSNNSNQPVKKETEAEAQARSTQENTDGHYITLVVARINGEKRYIVADSAANSLRLRDEKINEIIDLLDGRRIFEEQIVQQADVQQLVRGHIIPSPHMQNQLAVPTTVAAQRTLMTDLAQHSKVRSSIGLSVGTKIVWGLILGGSVYAGYKLLTKKPGTASNTLHSSQQAPLGSTVINPTLSNTTILI